MAGIADQLSATNSQRADDCPAPLSCTDVLAAFEAQSKRWAIEFGSRRIVGRTWGEGPPVYFLNGINGTHSLFAFVAWLFREQYRCVLFDYPGRSTAANAGRVPMTVKDFAAALDAVADLHRDDAYALFATSFGSLVALTAMLDRPQRISRAVLQGGFARRTLSRMERLLIRAFSRAPGQYRRLPLRRLVQKHNHRAWFPPFDAVRWDFLLDNTGSVPIADVAERAAVIRETDLRPLLPKITQPILLIRSEGDGIVAEACHHELENGLPNARSEWLSHSGHIPAVTHPHRLAKLVREFVGGP